MKIFVHPYDSAGHVNACLGVAQSLAKRGHKIYFVIADSYAGEAAKYGFEEILLNWTKPEGVDWKPGQRIDGHLGGLVESGLLEDAPPLEKSMVLTGANGNNSLLKFIEFEPQFKQALDNVKPDLIIADFCHAVGLPCILHGKIPYVLIHSSNPLLLFNSPDLPPPTTGFPSYDRSEWEKFDPIRVAALKNLNEYQSKLLAHFNQPEVKYNSIGVVSPYLNLYAYPEELDYTDLVPTPDTCFRLDAFVEPEPKSFEFPPEFKQKLKPGDKVVYISLGSMGSFNVQLMKNIVGALANTPHKYVVSKGPRHDEYDLPENMWGQAYLPQVDLLPLVDLVITHGGNNTVTETFAFGKPMIVMPMFVDQFDNAQRIMEKNFGIRMDTYNFEPQQLVDSVNGLLANQDVLTRATKAAKRIANSKCKDQLCQRLEQLVQQHKNS